MSPPNPDRSRRPGRRPWGVAPIVSLVIVGASSTWTPAAHAQDRTAAWLESQGLDELLARHLEAGLEAARGDQAARSRIAGRLARTYARLLRTVEDETRRAAIVERSRRMIDIVPEEDAGELRVALVRNRYVRASQVMEDDRIGVAEPEAVRNATLELEEIARELDAVRRMALKEIDRGGRVGGRVGGRRGEARLGAVIELAAASGLLEGWSRYYLGRASGDRRQFELAQLALGAVLQGDSPIPAEDEVSFDLQAVEGFASAILANAMVGSALDSPATAAAWFDRLDMTITHESIRRSAPGWRLASLIDAGDHAAAKTLFDELVKRSRDQGDAVLPVAWIRLAAVGGLRGLQQGPAAFGLAESALAALAARGELAQVRSLAESFGLDALGDRGFVFAYVRGLERHRSAIEARDAGDLAAATEGFAESVDLLRRAILEADAMEYPEASASATLMIGWSLLELDRSAEAADAFEDAAGRMAGDRRADALWGAIVALDRVVRGGGEGATDALARRDAIAERFLDAFPADDRSPSLVVRRIAEEETPDDDDIDVLLGVPESHPTWEIARRRVVQVLYRDFRQANDDAVRAETGRRMLAVADELLDRDRSSDGLFTDVRGLDGTLLRQAAEVACDEQVHEVSRGERYLGQLERALEHGALAEVPDLPNEILYRRLGLALGDGDFEFATRLLDQMPAVPDTAEAARWTRLAALRIHRAADAMIRDGAVSVQIARAGAEAGTRYLEAVAESAASEGAGEGGADGDPGTGSVDRFAALDRERDLPIAASVASARAAIFEVAGDRADGEEALAWYRAILERRPRDGSVLAATGRLATALGETEVALDAWRRLVRAAPEGDELWWQAKVGQIRSLLATDPAAARAVFDQMAVLHPELGPAPWRDQLRDLDVRITVALGDERAPESGGGA